MTIQDEELGEGVKYGTNDRPIDDVIAFENQRDSKRRESKHKKKHKKKEESSERRRRKSRSRERSSTGKKDDHRKLSKSTQATTKNDRDSIYRPKGIGFYSSNFMIEDSTSKSKKSKHKNRESKEKTSSKRKEDTLQDTKPMMVIEKKVGNSQYSAQSTMTDQDLTDQELTDLDLTQGTTQEFTTREIEIKSGNESNNDDEDEKDALVENAYSLLFTAPSTSSAFWFAMLVFIFQQSILWILYFDLFNFKKIANPIDDNAFQVPPGVSIQVTFAQGLAMLLAVAIQDDLIVAITKLVGGTPKIVVTDESSQKFLNRDSLSCLKWLFSSVLQFFAGLILLVVIFLLTMQAETVKDVCVNFAALMFIAEIDEIAFKLASYGFVTNHIQDQCILVQHCRIEKSIKEKRKQYIFYRVFFLIHFLVLFSGFGILVYYQFSGAFLCQTLFMQLGDSINPGAPLYSGLFYQQPWRIGDRVYYIDERGTSQISYCKDLKFWVMTTDVTRDQNIICNKYVAHTFETKTHDVTNIDPSEWLVLNVFRSRNYGVSEQFMPFDRLTLTCNECNADTCNIEDGECIEKPVSSTRDLTTGEIVTSRINSKVCQCKNGRYGINCEFPPPCETIGSDKRREPFKTLDPEVLINPSLNSGNVHYEDLESTFLLSNLTVKYRPLYYTDSGYIILFLGRRWGFSHINLFDNQIVKECIIQQDDGRIDMILDCAKDYFENAFHPLNSAYKIYYISEPMDYLTATDNVSPNDLTWFRTPNFNQFFWEPNTSGPSLICSECAAFTNECLNFGECGKVTLGVCECPLGTSGSLCELEENCSDRDGDCYNGGQCNEWTGECKCSEEFYGSLCQFRWSNESDLK